MKNWLSRRRQVAAAAGALFAIVPGILVAQAHATGVSASATISMGAALPDAKSLSVEAGPPGTAKAYTPSLHNGWVDLQGTVQGTPGQLITRTNFACDDPSSPNPVLYVAMVGGSGSASVSAHLTGTSRDPLTGQPTVYDQTVSNATGTLSTLSETQLLKVCSE